MTGFDSAKVARNILRRREDEAKEAGVRLDPSTKGSLHAITQMVIEHRRGTKTYYKSQARKKIQDLEATIDLEQGLENLIDAELAKLRRRAKQEIDNAAELEAEETLVNIVLPSNFVAQSNAQRKMEKAARKQKGLERKEKRKEAKLQKDLGRTNFDFNDLKQAMPQVNDANNAASYAPGTSVAGMGRKDGTRGQDSHESTRTRKRRKPRAHRQVAGLDEERTGGELLDEDRVMGSGLAPLPPAKSGPEVVKKITLPANAELDNQFFMNTEHTPKHVVTAADLDAIAQELPTTFHSRKAERREHKAKRRQLKTALDQRERKKEEKKAKADAKYEDASTGLEDLKAIADGLVEKPADAKNLTRFKYRAKKRAIKKGTTLEEELGLGKLPKTTPSAKKMEREAEVYNPALDVLTASRKRIMHGDSDDSDMEVDEGERELERMIFGDSQSFRNNLKGFGQQEQSLVPVGQAEDDENDDNNMGGMDDADLFFTDTTGTAVPPSAYTNGHVSDDSDDPMDGTTKSRNPAWHDSDDERISISLASVPRLRKLRTTTDEDIVSGKEYIKRLRKQYILLHPTPNWVTEALTQPPTKKRRLSASSASSNSDSDIAVAPLSSLLRSSTSLTHTTSKKTKLPPSTLNIQRLPDLSPSHAGPVQCLTPHPTLPLLLTSSHSTLHLHHLSPSPPAETPNPLLTSLHLRSVPLSSLLFHPSESKIFLSGRRPYLHSWDLGTGRVEKITRLMTQGKKEKSFETLRLSGDGKWLGVLGGARKGGGEVHLLDAGTMQVLQTVRVEGLGGVADFRFWNGNGGMTVLSKSGEVTEWDLGREEVVGRWVDEGAVGATVLSMGGENGQKGKGAVVGGDRWVAVGGQSGVVNVYDRREWYADWHKGEKKGDVVPRAPKPVRVLDQLTTPVSHLAFSKDGQVLAMASRWKKDALRLVHLPSCTVYKNWPTKATPLGRISSLTFGDAEEGALGLYVGNEGGKVRVWEIRP
ncbi:Hypothetical protein D9617_13g098370 [Elsinoe fawcettii]|nr:Hypothetical protein D9617_13g098370 [Elsinoe fawcettii]